MFGVCAQTTVSVMCSALRRELHYNSRLNAEHITETQTYAAT